MKLVEVENVEWINKKSYSTVGLTLQSRDSKILLRAPVGLEDWFELLEVTTDMSLSANLLIVLIFIFVGNICS